MIKYLILNIIILINLKMNILKNYDIVLLMIVIK